MHEGELGNYKQRLENAINAALADSPHISRAIEEIRGEGLEVFLIVEATIGFNRKDSEEAQAAPESPTQSEKLELSAQDATFLRKFGIRPD